MVAQLIALIRWVVDDFMLWVEVDLLTSAQTWVNALRVVPTALTRLRYPLIAALWLSFEAYIRSWLVVEREAGKILGVHLAGRHRILFCLVLSLIVGQLVLWLIPILPSIWLFIFFGLHGLSVGIFWRRGVSWCKQRLGVRPLLWSNPKESYDNLDFEN
jgi:hypothetical protein